MKRITAALFLGAALGAAGAQQAGTRVPDGVYQGTVGTATIVLRLHGDDSAYYYTAHAQPIPLTVSVQGGQVHLTEHPQSALNRGDTRTSTGQLTLRPQAGHLTGSWTTPSGARSLPVNLQPIDPATVVAALPPSPGLTQLQRQDLFTFLRLNHAWPATPPSTDLGGLAGVREPLSGVTYPHVPGAAAVNATLQDQQAKDALAALDCAASDPFPAPGQPSWDVKVQAERVGAALLTVRATGTAFCGGAHPGDVASATTLDVRSGQPMNVRALFPGLSDARLRAMYLATYTGTPDCRAAVQQSLSQAPGQLTPETFLTRSGLTLWVPDLPHYAFACNTTVTLSYASVKADADMQSPYFHALY